MDKLKQHVARARRRLVFQQFLTALPWCWFATLVLAAAAIAFQKLIYLSIDGWQWAAWWLAGALAVGTLIAAVWTWIVRRQQELDAALEIDRRFGLKERVSSSLALSAEELNTSCGQALVGDAERQVARLHIAQRFPIALRPRALLPLAPAAIALALCWLADPTRRIQANITTVPISQQLKQSTAQVEQKTEERKKEASDKGMQAAADLMKKVNQELRELAKKDQTDRREALAKLHDITQQLDERRQQLNAGDRLKQQLDTLKNLPGGPAEKLAQSIKNGNFDKALKELEKLQEQLASGKLSPEQQKQLSEQMAAMHDALQKMAEMHKKMQAELTKQSQIANQAGDQQAMKRIEEQLAKLQQQQSQVDAVQSIADQLAECSQCAKAGNMEGAQAALNQLASQLAQMQKQAEEMQMLDATLSDLDGVKECMCDKPGSGMSFEAMQDPKPGGKGIGRLPGGKGVRSDPIDAHTYDTHVKPQVTPGHEVPVGLADGPNLKGRAQEQIKNEIEAARSESADPLVGQKLPRTQRDHVQQYFDAFRTGQ